MSGTLLPIAGARLLVAAVTIIIQLIFLEGILSIDNAAVLGALVVVLPVDKLVPFPRSLAFLRSDLWLRRDCLLGALDGTGPARER